MTQPVLMTLASAAEHPLIDIDNTAFLQFAIFVVMALASTQLLFKPYLRMREARDEGMDGARDKAKALSAEADAKLADYEQKLASARARAQEERRKIRGEAAEHLQTITEKARGAALEAVQSATQKVETETASARAELLPKADSLAGEMAGKLLGREVA
ncbi:MAG: ATP synthase F0 subunit B [Myxococcales bacterium]|nr:ATP synthase F0 subunit B [Myxococcales bacterium]